MQNPIASTSKSPGSVLTSPENGCKDCGGTGETTAVDAIIADFATTENLAALRGKIVIIDLEQGGDGIANASAGAKIGGRDPFPCEMAALAQHHGAAGVIFVYAGKATTLRGTMLPISSLNSIWYVC